MTLKLPDEYGSCTIQNSSVVIKWLLMKSELLWSYHWCSSIDQVECSTKYVLLKKRRFLNLHILHFRCFIPCLGLKLSLHRVVYTKSVKESEEIRCISLQSLKCSFRKIQILKFAYSVLPLFYSLFRLKSSLHRVV